MSSLPTTWTKPPIIVWPLLAVPRDGAGAGWDPSALSPSVSRAGHGFTPFARHLEDCHAPDGLDENQDGHVSAEELWNSMKKMVNTKAAKKNLEYACLGRVLLP